MGAARAAGLSLDEVIDAIGSSEFFARANRLMLSLDVPDRPDVEGKIPAHLAAGKASVAKWWQALYRSSRGPSLQR